MTDRWVEQHNEAIPTTAEDRLESWEVCYELGYHSADCGHLDGKPVEHKTVRLCWISTFTKRTVITAPMTLTDAKAQMGSPLAKVRGTRIIPYRESNPKEIA